MASQDEQHLDLLAVFHYIGGGLTALLSCAGLVHVFVGILMVAGGFEGEESPPAFLGWLFIVAPGLFVLGGWVLGGLIIAAGRKLKRRRSRRFCVVVAALACVVMPIGTVLGVFTIIVLMRESVKELFVAGEARDEGGGGLWAVGVGSIGGGPVQGVLGLAGVVREEGSGGGCRFALRSRAGVCGRCWADACG